MAKPTTILALETSCDETAAAIIKSVSTGYKVLSSIISSQVKTHAKYGGIVPEVAARMHIEHIIPIVDRAINDSKIQRQNIDAIAVTGGPGLITSLLVGVETAKSLAYAWKKPLISVNHIEGHIYSALPYNKRLKTFKKEFKLPALCLIVSGGHTDLIYMEKDGDYERIGGTRDDAVGEAFDKVAKMMALGYPGGPIISTLALKGRPDKFDLPRPMINSGDFDMSFSGIKTAVFNRLFKLKKVTPQNKKDMCFEFQSAVTDVLVFKTIQATQKLGVKSIILGGGVSANQVLRQRMEFEIKNRLEKVNFYCPDFSISGDNAVMIGLAAHSHYQKKNFTKPFGFRPDPQWEL